MTAQKTDWNPELADEWAKAHGVEIDQSVNLCDQAFTVFDSSTEGLIPVAMATVAKAGQTCFFENFLTSPSLTVKEARECAELLEREAGIYARDKKCSSLIALVQSKGVLRELQKMGFEQQGSPMAFMRKAI